MTQEDRNAVLEEAARVCDRGEREWAGYDPNRTEAARICAIAIRALKEQEPTT